VVDPLIVPSIALLTGGGVLAARDYLKRRLHSSEDRYMALYGKTEWSASNMDLAIHCAPELGERLERAFLERLAAHLADGPEVGTLWHEDVSFTDDGLRFEPRSSITVDELVEPRRGVYLDLSQQGRVRVVWNHMQTDGVGMWNALRPLFDENPPLLSYGQVPAPPPVVPELLALPSVARRLVWRGRLREGSSEALTRGLARWDADRIRALKDSLGGSFNLLTSAMAVAEVLARHPDRDSINVGLTAYFPFLEGRNKYGVLRCRVRRGPLEQVFAQLSKQTNSKVKGWGMSAAQAYALGRVPDKAFAKLVGYYRQQVDVLVSSLPVGTRPITLDDVPSVVTCHPWELTLPYYFLLVGTRSELHVSFTSRYPQQADFLDLDRIL
jgi:hypothetical protein